MPQPHTGNREGAFGTAAPNPALPRAHSPTLPAAARPLFTPGTRLPPAAQPRELRVSAAALSVGSLPDGRRGAPGAPGTPRARAGGRDRCGPALGGSQGFLRHSRAQEETQIGKHRAWVWREGRGKSPGVGP